jgi:hypothetical protein
MRTMGGDEQGFLSAPERTRTSTREKPDKALNLVTRGPGIRGCSIAGFCSAPRPVWTHLAGRLLSRLLIRASNPPGRRASRDDRLSAGDARRQIVRDSPEIDELGGELQETMDVVEVGGQPERGAHGSAGR